MPREVSNASIQKDIKLLRDTVDRWRVAADGERKRMHDTLYGNGTPGHDEMIRDLQQITLSNSKNIERLIKEIKERDKQLEPVVIFYKVGIWLAGILGLSILSLIWGLLTGRAELIFH